MMNDLWTEAGEALAQSGTIPWDSYPRPQMVRDNWQNLNGFWQFGVNDSSCPERIRVPFCPESLLSGIHRALPKDATLYYRRLFSAEPEHADDHILLHFGAVDQIAHIFINDIEVGMHAGGYLPFTLDITEQVRLGADNELALTVTDPLDHVFPWGKQREDRGGMWYTPVSGIWQSVWLEYVPADYIASLTIESDTSGAVISAFDVNGSPLHGTVTLEIGPSYELEEGKAVIRFGKPHLWTPEDPYLYRFSLQSGSDCVSSYFALRRITSGEWQGKKRLLLNGKPYFFNGLLDQGYFSDGLYTPAAPELYEADILSAKALGFNTLRKHIKVEPEQFYYDCDRLGMVVFQDMVNNGDFHFLVDGVLPTAGLQHFSDKKWGRDPRCQQYFLYYMKETVMQLRNHPSILYWTIFNEGWGQFHADAAYDALREIDSTRIIDATSGWFHQKKSDVDSLHIYFRKLRLGKEDKPQLLSEFGGYVYKLPDHSSNPDKTYGYKLCPDRASFLSELRSLYTEQLLPLIAEGLSGAIYTQLSDVEDETNGLLSYDRRAAKLLPGDFSDISQKIASFFDT